MDGDTPNGHMCRGDMNGRTRADARFDIASALGLPCLYLSNKADATTRHFYDCVAHTATVSMYILSLEWRDRVVGRNGGDRGDEISEAVGRRELRQKVASVIIAIVRETFRATLEFPGPHPHLHDCPKSDEKELQGGNTE